MKGISYNKVRRKYQTYINIGNKKVSLGYYSNKLHAIKRLEKAQKALKEGEDIKCFLYKFPNPKSFVSTSNTFEEEFNKFEEDEEKEARTEFGYHKKMNFCFTNFQLLQKRYKDELKGKTHVVKKVKFFDMSPDLFRDKLIHFKYWKAHLAKIGKQITYCNPDMTEFELKLALLRVFQRNIYIPKDLQPHSDVYQEKWREVGEGLDDIVQESIYGIPERKGKVKNKIIFNPEFKLDKDERQKVVTEHTSKKRKDNTLKKLLKFFKPDMSRNELNRLSEVSLPTIRKHWEILNEECCGVEQV